MKKNTLIEYLKDNTDTTRDLVREVNTWDGSLENFDYYDNDEYFFQDFFSGKVDEAVRAICYGDYTYMDDYVRFNAYGNLESKSEFELKDELREYAEEILDRVLELYEENKITVYDEDFKILVDEYLEGMNKNGK